REHAFLTELLQTGNLAAQLGIFSCFQNIVPLLLRGQAAVSNQAHRSSPHATQKACQLHAQTTCSSRNETDTILWTKDISFLQLKLGQNRAIELTLPACQHQSVCAPKKQLRRKDCFIRIHALEAVTRTFCSEGL